MTRKRLGRVLAAIGLALAVWRGSVALGWFREWQATLPTDPSGAELYQLNFWLELVLAGLAFLLAGWGLVLARGKADSL